MIDIFLAGGVTAFQGLWLSKEYEKLRRKRINSGSEDEREPTEGEIRRQERLPKPGDFEFKEPILDWKTTKSHSDVIPGNLNMKCILLLEVYTNCLIFHRLEQGLFAGGAT